MLTIAYAFLSEEGLQGFVFFFDTSYSFEGADEPALVREEVMRSRGRAQFPSLIAFERREEDVVEVFILAWVVIFDGDDGQDVVGTGPGPFAYGMGIGKSYIAPVAIIGYFEGLGSEAVVGPIDHLVVVEDEELYSVTLPRHLAERVDLA